MKLFVDDKRACPESGCECAVDYEGAAALIKNLDFDFASLDYDLGGGKDGLDVLVLMHECGKYPSHINLHSNHIEGREKMRRYITANFPEGTAITMNGLD